MQKSERIVSYTMDELNELVEREGTLTDWAKVDALTEEELEASIDIEEEGEFDLSLGRVTRGMPRPQQQLTMTFDGEVVDWFKAQGDHYQMKMNAVLRNYVEDRRNEK